MKLQFIQVPKSFKPRIGKAFQALFPNLQPSRLYASRELNFHLVGIDFSEVAIHEAQATVDNSEVDRVQFRVTSFYETGLAEESIAAAISLDSLYLATSPLNALKEIYRVLQPDAPLIFTVYLESPKNIEERFSIEYVDWKVVLQSTGFSIIHYVNTTEYWRTQMRKKHEYRWVKKQRIRKELGILAEAELSVSESMLGLNGKPSFIELVSRFEIVAVKKTCGS